MILDLVRNECGRLSVELTEDKEVRAHAEIYKWSRQLYDEYMLIWIDLLQVLRELGYTKVVAHAKDVKTLKFQMMFGFMPTQMDTFDVGTYYRSEMAI